MSDAPASRGRTVVAARAIEQVVRAVTAEQFGVEAKQVSADMRDDGGRLDLAIRTPIRVVSIDRAQQDSGSIARSGGTVLEQAARGETAIIEQVGAVTGSTVSRVDLRLTKADIRQERRIR